MAGKLKKENMKRRALNSDRKFLILITSLSVIMLLMPLVACRQSPTANFSIQVGSEDIPTGLEIDAFFPNYIAVNEGDIVTFTQKTHEPHTITFGAPSPLPATFLNERMGTVIANPLVWMPAPAVPLATPGAPVTISAEFDGTSYVNSGVLDTPGDTFNVKFTKQGNYQFVCLLHSSSMSGTIVVQPAGSSYFQVQDEINVEVQEALADYVKSASDFLTYINNISQKVTTNGDNTHTYTVYAGAGDETQGFDFMYFFGGTNLSIKAGDTVIWTLEKNTPGMTHTVTFLSGEKEPDFIISQTQLSGTPQLIVNPKVSASSPVPQVPYAGSGYYNSGLLNASGARQSYTLTFTKPGKYDYICVPHDSTGMKGTITVTP